MGGRFTFNALNLKELIVHLSPDSTSLISNSFLLKRTNVNITEFAVTFRDVTLYFSSQNRLFSESVLYYANYVCILTRTPIPSPSAILDFRSLMFGTNDSDYEASQSVIFASFYLNILISIICQEHSIYKFVLSYFWSLIALIFTDVQQSLCKRMYM